MDIATYEPPVDMTDHDPDQYASDITECRDLALKVEEQYKEVRKREIMITLFFGVVGGAVGAAVGDAGGKEAMAVPIGTTVGVVAGDIVNLLDKSLDADPAHYIRYRRYPGKDGVIIHCLHRRSYTIQTKTAQWIKKDTAALKEERIAKEEKEKAKAKAKKEKGKNKE